MTVEHIVVFLEVFRRRVTLSKRLCAYLDVLHRLTYSIDLSASPRTTD